MLRPNILQYFYWGFIFALWWSIYGAITIPTLFVKAEGSSTGLFDIQQYPFIIQVVKNWAIWGFFGGIWSLVVLVNMSRKFSAPELSGIHTGGFSIIAAIAGGIICTHIYNGLELPQDVHLKSYYFRLWTYRLRSDWRSPTVKRVGLLNKFYSFC